MRAKVYSTLPSGMETVVKLQVGVQQLTAVVFGSIDFTIDGEVGFDFSGSNCIVFDKETGQNLALGRLEIV